MEIACQGVRKCNKVVEPLSYIMGTRFLQV
jgi:hypothetical protein